MGHRASHPGRASRANAEPAIRLADRVQNPDTGRVARGRGVSGIDAFRFRIVVRVGVGGFPL
jgi:hypothetical protein